MTSNAPAFLKSLIVYAVCITLSIVVGYLLTDPLQLLGYDTSAMIMVGLLILILVSPILIRWHHALLVLSLQMSFYLFFLKGDPPLWLAIAVLSLAIAITDRALNSEKHFLRVPQVTWPLMCIGALVLLTAELTGGIGLRALGSEVYGGKKYVMMFAGIVVYFALISRRVPLKYARLYLGLYFFSGLLTFIGDLYPYMPSWTRFIFWVFPPDANVFYSGGNVQFGETRLAGFAGSGSALALLLLAVYGIRGIFLEGKLWRLPLFLLAVAAIFLGGYRAGIVSVAIVFMVQFFLEGLHRTKLLPIFAFLAVFGFTALFPLASKLPFTAQRTIAFIPGLNLSTDARDSAQASVDWRIQMWTSLSKQVPQYLLLGKGLAIHPEDFNSMMGMDAAMASAEARFDPGQNSLALSYDYHNGPLSVLIPFGIWGAIAFLWLMIAGSRVMYLNLRHGDPALRTVNCFLFAYFAMSFVLFIIGGAIYTDLMKFASLIGLSVSFNGGVCQPAREAVPFRQPVFRPQRFQPQDALPAPQPRPAFPQ
jgi:hypothetical protein